MVGGHIAGGNPHDRVVSFAMVPAEVRNRADAVGPLEAFINHVEAQRGKKIEEGCADNVDGVCGGGD